MNVWLRCLPRNLFRRLETVLLNVLEFRSPVELHSVVNFEQKIYITHKEFFPTLRYATHECEQSLLIIALCTYALMHVINAFTQIEIVILTFEFEAILQYYIKF